MLGQRRARDRGADAEAAVGGLLDAGHLRDFLDVDDQAGTHHAGAHLHQEIGAAGKDAGGAGGRGERADRFIERAGREVLDIRHCCSRRCFRCPLPKGHGACLLWRRAQVRGSGKATLAGRIGTAPKARKPTGAIVGRNLRRRPPRELIPAWSPATPRAAGEVVDRRRGRLVHADLRLHRGRRRIGRRRRRQQAVGGPAPHGSAARSRPSRPSLDPRSGRLRQDDCRSFGQLAVQLGAGGEHRRSPHPGAARPHAGRLERAERPRLRARAGPGFRHLGADGQPRLELRRRPAVLQAHGALRGRRRRRLPGPRRAAARHQPPAARPAVPGADPGGRRGRHRAQPRLQRGPPGWHRHEPGHDRVAAADEHGALLPGPDPQARQPAHRDRRPDRGAAARRRALHGRALLPRRAAARGPRRPRGGGERRLDQFAAAPRAVGDRPAGTAARPRHRGSPRPAGGRREPAGPLRAEDPLGGRRAGLHLQRPWPRSRPGVAGAATTR